VFDRLKNATAITGESMKDDGSCAPELSIHSTLSGRESSNERTLLAVNFDQVNKSPFLERSLRRSVPTNTMHKETDIEDEDCGGYSLHWSTIVFLKLWLYMQTCKVTRTNLVGTIHAKS